MAPRPRSLHRSIEPLESRIAPAGFVSVSLGAVSVFDVTGGTNNLDISVNGANYHFSDPAGLTAGTGSTAIDASNVEVPIASVTGIFSITTTGGDDSITFSTALTTPGDLTIDTGNGTDSILVSAPLTIGGNANFMTSGSIMFADAVTMGVNKTLTAQAKSTLSLSGPLSILTASGTGGIDLSSKRDIVMSAGSIVTVADGQLSINANAMRLTGGNFVGVTLDGAMLSATGSGTVQIFGAGGNAGGAQVGILLSIGALITGGSGPFPGVNMTGYGGNVFGGSGNVGIQIDGGTITSVGGDVSIYGAGGNGGTSGESSGLYLSNSGALISAGGFGNVFASGTGGAATGSTNTGVDVRFGAMITSSGGNVYVDGFGGPNSASANPGVRAIFGARIEATGMGSLIVTGTGGGGTAGMISDGVVVDSGNAFIGSGGGPVVINGSATDGFHVGVLISNGSIATTGFAPLTINTDSIDIRAGGTINSGSADTLIAPMTTGTLIDVGGPNVLTGGTLTLGITDAQLDRISANHVRIGGNDGGLTVSAPITHSNSLSLLSSTGIVFNSSVSMGFNNDFEANSSGPIVISGVNARIATAGSGGISLLTSGAPISITAGAMLLSSDGNIVINANPAGTGIASFVGLSIDGALINTGGIGGISLSGVGGGGTSGQHGVVIGSSATIAASLAGAAPGAAAITLDGRGGASGGTGSHGVLVQGAVTTVSSSIHLIGTAGSGPASFGIAVAPSANIHLGVATEVISFTADTMDLAATQIDASGGTGTISLNTRTLNRAINLGAADNASRLGLTDAELDTLNAAVIIIGDSTSGPITISAPITRATPTDLQLFSGDKVIDFAGGSINSGGGSLSLVTGFAGTITTDASGVDVIGGNLAISAGNFASNGIGTVTNPLRINVNVLATTTRTSDAGQFFFGNATIGAATPDLTGMDAGVGTIRFMGGTFTLAADDLIADDTKVVVSTGATFSLAGHRETIPNLTGSGTIDLTGGTLSTGGEVNTSVDALIIGTGNFTKNASGVLTLTNAANTFGPGTITLHGPLSITSNAVLGNAGNTVVLDEGTLSVAAGFATTRHIIIGAGGGTIDVGSGTMKLLGTVDTIGILDKTGAGALKFSPDFVGTTRVDDGTLTTSGSQLAVTGQGSILVVVVDDGAGGTRIDTISLANTNATTQVFIAGPTNPDKTTTVTKIISQDATIEIGTITLGNNVILGDGINDNIPDVVIAGKVGNLVFGNVAAYTILSFGKGLPYNVGGNDTTPDTYNNRPNVTLKTILGPGVVIDVTGDGTPGGVGGGGLGKLKIDKWDFPGTVQTTQSIGVFKLKHGNAYVTFEVDKFHNGATTTADMGKIKIAEGSWGSSGSEIEGSIGVFDAKAFLEGASLSAASIGSFTTKKGKFAGTITLTDPNTSLLGTFRVTSDFTGSIDAAGAVKTILVSGDFKGSLKAKAIGSITAYSFAGATTDDLGVYGDPLRQNIWATGGSIGLLKTTAGGISDYEIIASTIASGFAIVQSSALNDTVGLDNVFVSAASIGNTSITLGSRTGASLTGIRGSVFNSQTTIGTITSSHSVMDSTVAAGTTLAAVTVGGNLTGSQLLAGVWLGADGVLGGSDDAFTRAASIAAITVTGKLGTTNLAAGIAPGTDGVFGTGDDEAAGGTALAGKALGALKFGGLAAITTSSAGLSPHFGIEAASMTSLSIGGKNVAIKASTFHAPGSDASNDIALRLI